MSGRGSFIERSSFFWICFCLQLRYYLCLELRSCWTHCHFGVLSSNNYHFSSRSIATSSSNSLSISTTTCNHWICLLLFTSKIGSLDYPYSSCYFCYPGWNYISWRYWFVHARYCLYVYSCWWSWPWWLSWWSPWWWIRAVWSSFVEIVQLGIDCRSVLTCYAFQLVLYLCLIDTEDDGFSYLAIID